MIKEGKGDVMNMSNNVRGETPEEKKLKKIIEKEDHKTREEKKRQKDVRKNVIH